MKNIVLTGFMGSGKSSVGVKLAEKLDMTVVDTDDEIEKESGTKISIIFSEKGETYFRQLEKDVVKKVSKRDDTVIITGGGVVLDKENIANLRKNGLIIFLHASPEVIYNRVKGESHRPLLQVKEPQKKIKELLDFRAEFYENNDLMIDTSKLSVDEVVNKIIDGIQEF
jgi:shikimate kinase